MSGSATGVKQGNAIMMRQKYLNSTANTREARMDRILSFGCLASNSLRRFLLADYAGGVHALTMTQST